MEKTVKSKIRSRHRSDRFKAEDYELLRKQVRVPHHGSSSKVPITHEGKTEIDLIAVIQAASSLPISPVIINNLLGKTQLSATLIAWIFEMTVKTLSKYKTEKLKLPTRYAELAVKLDILYSLGSELFGSTKDFNRWLGEESYGLNDKKPIEILNTVTGIDAVTDELKRIEYGATA